jgi:DNA-binding NarL/FixJ family response regulator
VIVVDNWQIIVLLGAIIIVYAYLIPRKSSANPQDQMIQDFEDAIEHLGVQLEEENKLLIEHIQQFKSNYDSSSAKLQGRIDRLEEQVQSLWLLMEKIPHDLAAAAAERAHSDSSGIENAMQSPPIMPASEMKIKDRYKDVFLFHSQGKSIEYIAKKLGMNKGEVQLIIELARQEEQHGA